ncbi:hypothetical protein ACFYY2_07350 [Streptomyces sp. NPDC001822]|uniref:hypothetical protein n=1 Tax=Streptomyces sp. NPDC001822 TaxID=3364614 RepID=UPI00369312A8
MNENENEGMEPVEPPPGMGPEDIEYWDDATRTYYERQGDGTVISRPYNENENRKLDEQLNLAELEDRLVGMSVILGDDYRENDIFLAVSGRTDGEYHAQVDALTRQINRVVVMVSALARVDLGELSDIGIGIE